MKRVGKSKVVGSGKDAGKGRSTGKGGNLGKGKTFGKGKAPVKAEEGRKTFGKGKAPAKTEEGRKTDGPKFKSSGKPFNDNADKKYSSKKKNTPSSSGSKPKSRSKAPSLNDETRLNRYLANAGICSRREADKYIESGIVTINGKVVTELGTKVKYGDNVKFNDAPLAPEKKTYVLLNKPKDYVTTLDDPHAKKIVIDLIKNGCQERVYPVGRLDKATTGLLLLTNDGDLAEFLAHPRNNKKKIYQATLDKPATTEDLQKLYTGVTLEDGTVKADEITFVDSADKRVVGIEIHSGKNRVVRRMFEHIEYKVKKLDRVYFAGLTKKNLPRGKWRFLSEKEVTMLKRGIYS